MVMNSLLDSLSFLKLGEPMTPKSECELLAKFVEDQAEYTLPALEISEICEKLIRNRICFDEFLELRPARKWIFLIFRVLRTLFRNKTNVEMFHKINKYSEFVKMFDFIASRFLRNEQEWGIVVVNCLNVTQKLVDNGENAQNFVDSQLQTTVLKLLATRQMSVLQHSLEILGRLSDWSEDCRENLCESNTIDVCLELIPDDDVLTQKLCVSLLRILSCDEQAREQIRIYDGVPRLLGLISIRNSRLQWHVAWTLARLAEQLDTAMEIARLGGISLIFAELSNPKPPEKAINDWIGMLTGLSALLAQLCQSSSNQQIITNCNGVYILGKLLAFKKCWDGGEEAEESWRLLQSSIFRALRLLFPFDRARQLLKKVFETDVYEKFVDIGNYVHEIGEYEEVSTIYQKFLEQNPEAGKEWENVNERKQAMGEVGEYELLDQLGAGAFGCVYTVRKKTQHSSPAKLLALKEIFMTNLGDRESEKSFGDTINEVKIIKQQLRHPNTVRYRRIFVENHRLYILMDLIQGASLRDHIVTMKEKRSQFEEAKIWSIVIQMMLALRYLHKEKQIIHRDLKPNNIMITDNDRVVITDFGLAKQKGPEYLKSAAGTIVYSCPEIVQNLPYGEKSDIWSFGCCVYELCQLKAAFHSSNMLTLAMQIVEAKYDPIDEHWSEDLSKLITSCLKPDPSDRPDISNCCSIVGSRILEHLDEVARQQASEVSSSDTKHEESSSSLNSSTNSFHRPKRSGSYLPPINPERLRTNSTSENFRSSTSLPRISSQARRRVKTCSTEHPTRSNSSTDLKSGLITGLTVRSTALKQIKDPVLTILDQIHKILKVTEKESGSTVINHQKRLVEMFRKKVLGKESNPEMIKLHLRKLASESAEQIDMNLGFSDYRPVLLQAHLNGYQKDQKVTRITYEQLAGCIQNLISD